MSRRIVASHKSGSPMDLVKGIYNPPASMSKRTARRWAEVAPRLAASEESGSVPVVPENFDVLDFEVTPEKSGQSLLTFLVQNTEMDTPKVRKKLKKSDHVWVEAHGGKVIVKPRGDLRLMAGFKVHMMMMRPKPLDLNADSLEAAINKVKPGVLYKDEHIMIVNKPHGMATHAGSRSHLHLEGLLTSLEKDETKLPRLVHRLDKNTSGAMIIARTKEAAARVSEMFRNEGQIIRMYAALTIPPLDKKVYKEGDKLQIVSGIASNGKPAPHEKMDIFDYVDDGIERKTTGGDVIKRAVTNVTVAHNQRLASLLALEPTTGRKHQLRLHCARILKSFIVGDYKYGTGCTKDFRPMVSDPLKVPMFLHLYKIALKNWYPDGSDLIVTSPVPPYFRQRAMSAGLSVSKLNMAVAHLMEKLKGKAEATPEQVRVMEYKSKALDPEELNAKSVRTMQKKALRKKQLEGMRRATEERFQDRYNKVLVGSRDQPFRLGKNSKKRELRKLDEDLDEGGWTRHSRDEPRGFLGSQGARTWS